MSLRRHFCSTSVVTQLWSNQEKCSSKSSPLCINLRLTAHAQVGCNLDAPVWLTTTVKSRVIQTCTASHAKAHRPYATWVGTLRSKASPADCREPSGRRTPRSRTACAGPRPCAVRRGRGGGRVSYACCSCACLRVHWHTELRQGERGSSTKLLIRKVKLEDLKWMFCSQTDGAPVERGRQPLQQSCRPSAPRATVCRSQESSSFRTVTASASHSEQTHGLRGGTETLRGQLGTNEPSPHSWNHTNTRPQGAGPQQLTP